MFWIYIYHNSSMLWLWNPFDFLIIIMNSTPSSICCKMKKKLLWNGNCWLFPVCVNCNVLCNGNQKAHHVQPHQQLLALICPCLAFCLHFWMFVEGISSTVPLIKMEWLKSSLWEIYRFPSLSWELSWTIKVLGILV